MEARRLSPFVGRAANISVVHDLMVHDLDLCSNLVGSAVETVQAVGIRGKSPHLDHVSAHLTFGNGVIANLTGSKISQHKVRDLTVICEGCVVEADLLARVVVIRRQSTSDYRINAGRVMYHQEGVVEQVLVPSVEPLFVEIGHFLKCIRNGRNSLAEARDAIRVLELAEAIERIAS